MGFKFMAYFMFLALAPAVGGESFSAEEPHAQLRTHRGFASSESCCRESAKLEKTRKNSCEAALLLSPLASQSGCLGAQPPFQQKASTIHHLRGTLLK